MKDKVIELSAGFLALEYGDGSGYRDIDVDFVNRLLRIEAYARREDIEESAKSYSTWKWRCKEYKLLLSTRDTEIAELKAEIKRLREELSKHKPKPTVHPTEFIHDI